MPHSSESCERHLEAGRRALSLGDLATAEAELRAAVSTAEATPASADVLSAALASLSQLLYQTRRFTEAAPVFARTLELREAASGTDDPALVPALHNLAAVHVAAGNAAEAEPLLRRALAILEHAHGEEHPELAGVLNALSQLCLKRGAHAEAEPLLKRLLTIRRAEGGEERPEVATVMASLATVHQAMAEHDAAERLLRRVLEIRERTLAPSHFAIATSLEALAETCATRGKLAEALGLLERALDIRERTLEPAHASVAVVRSRIADLQLQLSSDTFAVPLMEPMAEVRLVPQAPSANLPAVRASMPAPAVRASAAAPTAPITEFRAPDGLFADLRAPSNGAAPEPMRRTSGDRDAMAAPTVDRAEQSSLSVAYLPTGSALVLPGERAPLSHGSFEGTLTDEELGFEGGESEDQRSASLFGRSSTRLAMLGVALLTLGGAGALVAKGMKTEEGDGFVRVPSAGISTPATTTAAGNVALPESLGGSPGLATDSNATQPASAGPKETREGESRERESANAPSRSTTRTAESRSAREGDAPPAPVTPAPISAPALDRLGVRIDPTVPALDVNAAATQREAGAAIGALRSDRKESAYALQPSLRPAGLIGEPPQPKYPTHLRRARLAGYVNVSFIVDAQGRVDSSSFRVIDASDMRFVGSVAEVLPQLRFVAAESAGVKVPQRVEMGFRFTP